MRKVLFGLALIAMSSCAHRSHPRGSVAIVHGANEADICMGEGEVVEGDAVEIYKNVCTSRRKVSGRLGRTMPPRCQKVKVGDARIDRVLDEHYSTIQSPVGVELKEGYVVEKAK